MTEAAKVASLERRVLKTTMRRYREHRKMYGPIFVPEGHTAATVLMIKACQALYEATRK